jgi:hypothetical protein
VEKAIAAGRRNEGLTIGVNGSMVVTAPTSGNGIDILVANENVIRIGIEIAAGTGRGPETGRGTMTGNDTGSTTGTAMNGVPLDHPAGTSLTGEALPRRATTSSSSTSAATR